MNCKNSNGLTLLELLIVMSVVGVLLSMVPNGYAALTEKRRLEAAAEAVRSHLYLARSEAIRQMRAVTVTHPVGTAAAWQLGLNDEGVCDTALMAVDAEGACSLRIDGVRALQVLHGAEYPGVSATASRVSTRFDPLNGTTFGSNATVRLTSGSGRELRIVISNVGRIRTCSPGGAAHVSGFSTC